MIINLYPINTQKSKMDALFNGVLADANGTRSAAFKSSCKLIKDVLIMPGFGHVAAMGPRGKHFINHVMIHKDSIGRYSATRNTNYQGTSADRKIQSAKK